MNVQSMKSPLHSAGEALSASLCERLKQEFAEWKAKEGQSQDALGRLVYPELDDPQKKISNVLNSKQALKVSDFFALSRAMNKDPLTLMAVELDALPRKLKKTIPNPGRAVAGKR